MKSPLLIMALFFLASCGTGGFTVDTSQSTESYSGGGLKRLQQVRVKRYNSGDLYSFYQRTALLEKEFYPDSSLKSWKRKVTRVGEGGGACYSRIEITREFGPNGEMRKETKVYCDGKKVVTRYFDEKGHLLFTRTERRYL